MVDIKEAWKKRNALYKKSVEFRLKSEALYEEGLRLQDEGDRMRAESSLMLTHAMTLCKDGVSEEGKRISIESDALDAKGNEYCVKGMEKLAECQQILLESTKLYFKSKNLWRAALREHFGCYTSLEWNNQYFCVVNGKFYFTAEDTEV